MSTKMNDPYRSHHEQKSFRGIGMIARWRPVHLGHKVVLQALCNQADHVLIGIGSANEYDVRNPFTAGETDDMLRLVLSGVDNFMIIPVPDLHDGPRWRVMVQDLFGDLDAFVTANPYVAHLMKDIYQVIHPAVFVPEKNQLKMSGTMVRDAMARGEDWLKMVPEEVGAYIVENRLDERFRREFGLQTLALSAIIQ